MPQFQCNPNVSGFNPRTTTAFRGPEVRKAEVQRIQVLWDVTLCCCVRCCQRVEWKYCQQLKRSGSSKYWTAWTLKKTALQSLETSETSHLTTQCYSYADTNPHPKRFPQKWANSDVEAPNQSAPPDMRGSSASRWTVSVSSHPVLHRATFTTQLYASHARRVQLSTGRRLILRLDFWLALLLRRLW